MSNDRRSTDFYDVVQTVATGYSLWTTWPGDTRWSGSGGVSSAAAILQLVEAGSQGLEALSDIGPEYSNIS